MLFAGSDVMEKITILSFGVEIPDKNGFPSYIKSFDNPFKFISSTLSVKNKTIYIIISTDKIHSVLPIIHRHYCVEKIYLHGPTETESSFNWFSMSEKVNGCYLNINEIYEYIFNDITTTTKNLPHWNRSVDCFTILYTQQWKNQSSIIDVSTDILHDEHIIIFRRGDRRRLHIDQKSIPVMEFTDIDECLQQINLLTQSQIFLIISGNVIPLGMRAIFDSPQIHAVYFYGHHKFEHPVNKRKVSGCFEDAEELHKQLHKDISFYREHHIHTCRIDVFPMTEPIKKVMSHPSDQQTAFLIYNLLMDILPQTPLLKFNSEELIKLCNILFPNGGEEAAHYVRQIYERTDEGTDETMNFIQDPKFSQIALRLHQHDQLNELLILQKPLVNIQQTVLKSTQTPRTVSVYLSKIISKNTLETMKSNNGEFINLGIFTLATRAFLTARSIARKMADNGLVSILFQIEVVEGTRLLEIDPDRVVFHLCAVFRLQSINLAPDGVWYANIVSADSDLRPIKEQLQLNIGAPLSWLTFGNYLHFLHQSRQGKAYFEYLLHKLLERDMNQSDVCSNRASPCPTGAGDDEVAIAEEVHDDDLECAQAVESGSAISERKEQTCAVVPPKNRVDRSTVLGNIADIHYQMKDHKLALQYYEQALELSVDLYNRSHYQQMIATVKNCIKSEFETV